MCNLAGNLLVKAVSMGFQSPSRKIEYQKKSFLIALYMCYCGTILSISRQVSRYSCLFLLVGVIPCLFLTRQLLSMAVDGSRIVFVKSGTMLEKVANSS